MKSIHDEDNSRFDYCDDSDGTSSGDEDYLLYSNFAPDEAEESLDDGPGGGSCIEENVCNTESNNRTRKTNSAADAIEKEVRKIENGGGDIAVGDKFDSKETLVARLRVLSVLDKYDYNVRYSTPVLLIVECWVKGCKWRIRASTMGDSPVFHIRRYCREHTCSVTERYGRSRNAKPPILGQLYKDYVGGVGSSVVPNLVGDGLNLRYGVQLGYWKAHRTLIKAREYVRGTPESGYAELPAYLYRLRSSNPGTLTRLVVDAEDRFKYVFIAIAGCIKGFRYMRKVVVVDGTFLKGEFKGTLLIATTQDGNFNIFPLAYAVVDTENDVSWEWFFTQLSSVIPDDEELALISDRHKSIGKAIAKVYPLASRGICTYHLHKNIILRFSGSETFRLVKKAAAAYRVVDFEEIFQQIQEANPQLHAYLVRADVTKWSRAHFPGDRYNFTTSNIAESLNKVLNPARAYPIVELLEAVRNMLTRWFATRRKQAAAMPTLLTKGVENLLQARIEQSRRLKVQEIDEDRFELSGERMPCVHAIAAAYTANVSVINQHHPYFRRDSLCSGYAEAIMPIDTSCIVPTDITPSRCKPPFVRNPPGRPKMTRRKSFVEVALETKRPRKQHACSQCQQVGDNRTTYPANT
ncbi:PREDICTED: uncharacterized protein LOC104733708 [Camelina sativa]|uniref:Uncharacterized protein LOC104733708 n=1 Tax=Camelina sativa TaxID=90675 RepID=A0ABM1QQX9_CAMSA|nr:PREDICTED: uncharacterized protein LOC104733708 [Camelina sativa]